MDIRRYDLTGDGGVLVLDLAVERNNIVGGATPGTTYVHEGDKDFWWAITAIEVDEPDPEGMLAILSGISIEWRIRGRQLRGRVPLRFVQPPFQNLSVFWDPPSLKPGIVRLHWQRITVAEGEAVWGSPGA